MSMQLVQPMPWTDSNRKLLKWLPAHKRERHLIFNQKMKKFANDTAAIRGDNLPYLPDDSSTLQR